MLTGSSSSSYLNPDYLQPISTTTDAKNSPLALLAATCNNIGKDDSAKSIIPPIERRDKLGDRESSPTSPNDKKRTVHESSRSPFEDNYSRENKNSHSPIHERRVPRILHTPERERSVERKSSPQHLRRSTTPSNKSPPSGSTASGFDIKNNNSASKISVNCGSLSVEINHKESHGSSSSHMSRSPPSSSYPPTSSGQIPGSHTGLLSAYYPHLAALSGYSSMLTSPLSHSGAAAALLASAQKSDSTPHVPVTYTTVKTVSGASTLVPVCADPYCSQCKLSVQSAQLSASLPCPAGCTQCSRDKPTDLSSHSHHGLSGLHGLHSGLHHPSAMAAAAAAAGLNGLYGTSAGIPPSTTVQVCNWVGGGKYCGERFNSSEELMTHLRTHTSSIEQHQPSVSSSIFAANLAAAQSAAALSGMTSINHPALAALSHLYQPQPPAPSLSPTSSLRSAASLSRSLSPNSILSASRYHPYLKSPLPGLNNSSFLGVPSFTPTSLGSYPPLYPFGGGRLGPLVP